MGRAIRSARCSCVGRAKLTALEIDFVRDELADDGLRKNVCAVEPGHAVKARTSERVTE
jgi:hypothetical protein